MSHGRAERQSWKEFVAHASHTSYLRHAHGSENTAIDSFKGVYDCYIHVRFNRLPYSWVTKASNYSASHHSSRHSTSILLVLNCTLSTKCLKGYRIDTLLKIKTQMACTERLG